MLSLFFTTQPRLFSPPLSYIEERMETIPCIDEDEERKGIITPRLIVKEFTN